MEKIKVNGLEILVDRENSLATITINKPYPKRDGLHFAINEKSIYKLINDGIQTLKVKVEDHYLNFKPEWFLKHAKQINQVFLYPDSPMRMREVNLSKFLTE